MSKGPKYKRSNPLSKVLEDFVERYYDCCGTLPTWREVLAGIEDEITDDTTVQEVCWDDEKVDWCDKGLDKKPVSFRSIRERLTVIRKKIENP